MATLDTDTAWKLILNARNLISLFLPLCQPIKRPAGNHVVGQLGQSLDGRIATVTGCSRFINGDDGITHLHRIRALCDAVVVGAGTAATDTPRLTVRRANGPNPVDVDVTLNKADVYPFGHEEYTLGLSASTVIKRSDWGMTYGMDEGMVGDEVVLRFAFEAIKD